MSSPMDPSKVTSDNGTGTKLKDVKHGQWCEVTQEHLNNKKTILYRPLKFVYYRGDLTYDYPLRNDFVIDLKDGCFWMLKDYGELPARILNPGETISIKLGQNRGELP